MRDPILQEKRQEHVMFQKYALELLERVSGKSKHMGAEFETSLANIHRVNLVVTYSCCELSDSVLLYMCMYGLPTELHSLNLPIEKKKKITKRKIIQL